MQVADCDTTSSCIFILKEYDIPKDVADEIFNKLIDCVPEAQV